MGIKKISPEKEEQLIGNVKEAIALANDGLDPSDAVAKVASANDYNLDFTKRMVTMFNTSKTLSYFSKEAGQARAADFETADIDKVVEAIAPVEKSAIISEIISGKDFMSIHTNALEKAASEQPKLEAYATDISPTVQRASAMRGRLRNKVAEAKLNLAQAKDRQFESFDKAASYFREPNSASFSEVETKMRGAYKEAGEALMSSVWGFLGNWQTREKRGSHSERIQIIDNNLHPYAELHEAFDASEKVAEAYKIVCAAEKELEDYSKKYAETINELYKSSEDNTLYIESDEEDEVVNEEEIDNGVEEEADPEDTEDDVDGFQYQITVEDDSTKESSFADFMLGDAPSPGATPSKDSSGGAFNLGDTTVNSVYNQHNREMQRMDAVNMLQDLMVQDNIISAYEPDEVLYAYNEIARFAPSTMNQPAVLRGYLRKFLESSTDPGVRGLEGFDVEQLAKINKGNATDNIQGGGISG